MTQPQPPASEEEGTRRTGRRAALMALAGLAAAGLGAWVAHEQRQPGALSQPETAVATLLSLSLPDHAGVLRALGDWRGRTLVVNFWATWCGPCVEEMPELSALQREHAPEKMQIVGIGVDSSRNIAEFAQKYPMSYPLLVAGAQGIELARQFGDEAGGLPFTVVIDPGGQIVARTLGRVDLPTLRHQIERAAQAPVR